MKKILRIITRLNIGGPAIHTILLTEGLDKTRFLSLLVCGSVGKDEGDMIDYAYQKNVKPYIIPELKRELSLLKDIIAFKKIYSIIKTEQPDIIHTHTAKAGALGRLAAIFYLLFHPQKKIKLIHTFHGHVFSGYFNALKSYVFILVERFLAIFTSKIVAVSDLIKKELLSLGISNEERIEVIPLGLELDKFLLIPVHENRQLNIDIIGRLVPIKNHRLFLEAAAKVLSDCQEMKLRFRIIGDGNLRSDLEEYSQQLNIHTHVFFLGWQKDLAHIYSDSDIVALTSINEGTPVSLIEAMASGRAIVATDVGGVKDLLGRGIEDNIKPDAKFKILERGVVVKPNDTFSFAKALLFLAQQNELRNNMGKRGRDFVKNKFTKERLIKDIENLYSRILICSK